MSKELKFSKNEFKSKKRYQEYVQKGKIDPEIEKEKQKLRRREEKLKKIMGDDKENVEEEEGKEEHKANAPAAVAEPNSAPAAAAAKKSKEEKPEINKYQVEVDNMLKGEDIKGFLYFRSEWKGEGSKMPPAIRLLIEKEMGYQETQEDVKIPQSKIIDVNDPKYKSLIQAQKDNNKHLQELIKKDSLNPLHDLQPFRHIQLINQDTHYELVNIDIPILETEVVNDPELSYLIEKFAKLGAMQTYGQMKREVGSYSGTDRIQNMEPDVLARRQKFKEKIKRVQKDIKTGQNKPNINYTSIITEEGDINARNPCAGLAQRIFAPRRKLRPRVQEKTTISISQCPEATLRVQIISGINIPVRTESIKSVENFSKFLKESEFNPNAPNRNNLRPGQNPQFPQGAGGGQYPPGPPGAGGYPQDLRNNQPYGNDPRGPRTDYGGNYNRPFDNSGGNYGNNQRFGGTDPYSRNFQDRNLPQYSGYGVVENPYGANRSGYGTQFNPQNALGQQPADMGALQKAKMELTGINNLIQGSVFIEVRLVSSRRPSEPPQIKRTRECKGSFPDWNETVNFKILPANGTKLTEEELMNGDDMLYFSVFDKYESEKRVIMTNKHEITVENKFLGSF